MTAATISPGARLPIPVAAAQTAELARRSIVGTARQPTMWFPAIIFPLLIAAVNAAAFNRAPQALASLGFPPVVSFLQFLLPGTLTQGVMFGGIIGGSDVALDIENGFFERLLASPVARTSILVGRLAGSAVLGACQALIFVGVFVAFGAPIEGGLAAVVVLVVTAMLLALAVGGFAAAIGLRSGSQEAVQNAFPLLFVLVFVSSAFFPTALMKGWYQSVAERNPITWMIDALRSLVVYGFDWTDALTAVAVAAGLAAVAAVMATRQFRRRLRSA
ncbi:ABC transporter permease [Rhabdothermincola sp.]|uniref:ABC transporter permease n=1 Tax=Rhabdothermincola sp. TaxID=2820405 RepID=UPI002FE241A8